MTESQFEKAVEALISNMDFFSRNVGGSPEPWHSRFKASYGMLSTLFGKVQAMRVLLEAERRAKLRDITIPSL